MSTAIAGNSQQLFPILPNPCLPRLSHNASQMAQLLNTTYTDILVSEVRHWYSQKYEPGILQMLLLDGCMDRSTTDLEAAVIRVVPKRPGIGPAGGQGRNGDAAHKRWLGISLKAQNHNQNCCFGTKNTLPLAQRPLRFVSDGGGGQSLKQLMFDSGVVVRQAVEPPGCQKIGHIWGLMAIFWHYFLATFGLFGPYFGKNLSNCRP